MDFIDFSKLTASAYYAIPDYQRDYSWKNEHLETLMDDVRNLIINLKNESHFLGAIVTIPYSKESSSSSSINPSDYSIDESTIKHVVDGQQRLITLSLFLKSLLQILEDEGKHTDNKIKHLYAPSLTCLCGADISPTDNDQPAPRLILNGNSGNFYNTDVLQIRNSPCKRNLQGAGRINRALKFFHREIIEFRNDCLENAIFPSDIDFYSTLLKTILHRLRFVVIECPDSANAFQVFDSLNGKGLDLTAADRIKNLFLSWCPNKIDGKNKWDIIAEKAGEDNLVQFFSCLLFYENKKRISRRHMPDYFTKYYNQERFQRNFDTFYSELKQRAEIYGLIKRCETGSSYLDNELLPDINELNQEQLMVMLFAVPLKYGQEIFKKDGYYQYVLALTTLIVRMQVCEKSSNKLDRIFTSCLNELDDDEKTISHLTAFVRAKAREQVTDDEFRLNFKNLKFKNTQKATYYVRTLENYRRRQDGKQESVKTTSSAGKKLSVEHIIPQDAKRMEDWYGGDTDLPYEIKAEWTERVVQSIGNMILLYQGDNSSASNENYQAKVSVYKNGIPNQNYGAPITTFSLVNDLVNQYPSDFSYKSVQERSEHLADIALEIWK